MAVTAPSWAWHWQHMRGHVFASAWAWPWLWLPPPCHFKGRLHSSLLDGTVRGGGDRHGDERASRIVPGQIRVRTSGGHRVLN